MDWLLIFLILFLLISFLILMVINYKFEKDRAQAEFDLRLAVSASIDTYNPIADKQYEVAKLVLERAKRRYRVLQLITAYISLVTAALAVYLYFRDGTASKASSFLHEIFSRAYAQALSSPSNSTAALSQNFLGHMLTAILAIMLIVFVLAAFAVLFLKDTEENAGRRAAANDLVKTLGGFFTGVLTSFLKQAIGS